MNNQTIKSKLLTTLGAFLITIMSFGSVAGVSVPLTGPYEYQECNGEEYFVGDGRPVKVIKTLGRKGNADAQYLLGRMYQGGGLLKKSMPHSMMWYRMAAKQKHKAALFYLACVEYQKKLKEVSRRSKVTGGSNIIGVVNHKKLEDSSISFSYSVSAVIEYYEMVLEPQNLVVQHQLTNIVGRPSAIESGERYSPIASNGFKSSIDEPLSTLSIDVDTASYAHMRRYLQQYGELPPKDAIRIEELINYFTYDYPQPEGDDPFSVTTEVSTAPWNPEHQLVHIGLQGRSVDMSEAPASNLVFLIDTSGSMTDDIVLVKQALKMLVNNLRDQDSISIVTYAGSAGLALPATKGSDKDVILAAIDSMSAGGSTAGGAGIKLAYKIAKQNYIFNGNNRVILASDGNFNVGVSSREGLIKLIESKRDERIFLSVLGFGYSNYADELMEPLADSGNGNYYYIDNLLEAKKVLVKEMGGTLYTIAKDVKIQVEFNPEKVAAYRLIGYENRLLNKEDFNDDKKDAGELGAGHTVTALYEIIPVGVAIPTGDVDDLKYQQTSSTSTAKSSDEVMTVKLRYKEPTGETSKLITVLIKDAQVAFEEASDNFRFSSAVAAFGMLLRGSEYLGNMTAEEIQEIAKNAKGEDLEGYRAEFVRLIELAELLTSNK